MVVVKYKKINEGMFFSHLNMLRLWNKLLAISNVKVNYSQGFNKTRRLFFSSPTRVGVESKCDYIEIDTEEKARDVKEKLIHNLPSWMEIIEVWYSEKKVNIAALNKAALYSVSFDEYKSCKVKIKEFFEQASIVLDVVVHGEEKQIEVRDRIFDYSLQEEGFTILASVGEINVRIDTLLKKLLLFINKSTNEFAITKEDLYVSGKEKRFINVDEYLNEVSTDD